MWHWSFSKLNFHYKYIFGENVSGSIFLLTVLGGLLSPICILGWQLYQYLRYDEWIGVSVITGLQALGMEWALYPDDWLGLYELLDMIHLGFGLLICSFLVAYLISDN